MMCGPWGVLVLNVWMGDVMTLSTGHLRGLRFKSSKPDAPATASANQMGEQE
jgi:hypothetical protein